MGFAHKLAFLVCVVAIIAGVKYYSYPADIATPRWKVFIVDHINKLSFDVIANIVHTLGFDGGNIIIWRQEQQRKWRKPAPDDEPGFHINWIEIEGVKVLTYLPEKRTAKSPAVVFIHGGGWAYFEPDFYDKNMMRPVVQKLQMPVFSIDYRKAPNHPYPAALEDCWKVFKHLQKFGASKFDIDPTRLAVMGDSAGGNLAAALSLKLKLESGSKSLPKLQVLIYPALQMFDFQHPSMQFPDNILLSRYYTIRMSLAYMGFPPEIYFSDDVVNKVIANNHTSAVTKRKYKHLFAHEYLSHTFRAPRGYESNPNEWGEDKALANQLQSRLTDPLAWPLMATTEQLKGLPPAYISTCQYDVLRDHGILYAHQLEDAGVEVELSNMPGGFHGIISLNARVNFPQANYEIDKIVKFIRSKI